MKIRQKINILFMIILILFPLTGTALADKGIKGDQIKAVEDLFEGFVYYANEHKTALRSVKNRFSATLNSHDLGLEIIKILFEGPSGAHLEAVWSQDTKINSFFIADDGKAYVDIVPDPAMIENMDTGEELLAIYSLVNSLTVNIPEIKMVKLLIRGKDALTLAGHIDLEYFYKTNMLIVT